MGGLHRTAFRAGGCAIALCIIGCLHIALATVHPHSSTSLLALFMDMACTSLVVLLCHEYHCRAQEKLVFCLVPMVCHAVTPVWGIGWPNETCAFAVSAALGATAGYLREFHRRLAFLESQPEVSITAAAGLSWDVLVDTTTGPTDATAVAKA
jgi:hypothetical protein